MKPSRLFLFCIFSVCILSACGQRTEQPKDDIIAYVNKEPVFSSELERSLALAARQDPLFKLTDQVKRDHIEGIINKKIIIQNASEAGLARQERFINTIKTFWEQTLIREFYEYKRKQSADALFVTEDDIVAYYTRLGQRVTFHIFKSSDQRRMKDLYARAKKGEPLDVAWETVGPVGYEDVTNEVLLDAFGREIGDLVLVEEGPSQYLVEVVAREAVAMPALGSVHDDMRSRVLSLKERRAFDEWLKKEREHAKVNVVKK